MTFKFGFNLINAEQCAAIMNRYFLERQKHHRAFEIILLTNEYRLLNNIASLATRFTNIRISGFKIEL